MANKKKITAKSKTKTSKYSKLMLMASKELADKKKSLAQAEKTLATAQKNHQDLLQETARLDMLERSLKALVDGTEPPQNIKYVYSYPQWVYPYPNQWWNNGGFYTTAQNPTYGLQTQTYGYGVELFPNLQSQTYGCFNSGTNTANSLTSSLNSNYVFASSAATEVDLTVDLSTSQVENPISAEQMLSSAIPDF